VSRAVSDGRGTAGDGDLLSLVDGGVWGSGQNGGGHDGEGGVLELHLDGRFVYKKRLKGEKRKWFVKTKAIIDFCKEWTTEVKEACLDTGK
jgi:hypothetical protein